MAVTQLLTPADIGPWKDYLAKKITHHEALAQIFSKIRLSQEELDSFIASIKVDSKFTDVLELCKSRNIPIYICSAGMDYYIYKRIGEEIKKYNITVLANIGQYCPKTGFKLTTPSPEDKFYDYNAGISKANLVKELKNEGYFTVYAGDGIPDLAAAREADIVFAKAALLKLCQEENIPIMQFNGFEDILKYFKINNE